MHNKTKILENILINMNGGKGLLNSYDIENKNTDLEEYSIGYSFANIIVILFS